MNEKEYKEKYSAPLSLASQLRQVEMISNSRPHQYEHEHFMLIESMAQYLINRDLPEFKEEEE